MSGKKVARVTEIIAGSPTSFEDATKVGIERATRTLRGITGMRVMEQSVSIDENQAVEFRVRLEVIFVLEH